MNLVRWRNKRGNLERPAPEQSWRTFRTELDHLFDRFFEGFAAPWPDFLGGERPWAPALDVTETDRDVTIRAEVPGVDPKDIEVTVSGNVLTIAGEKKCVSESKTETGYRCERQFGRFRRSIELPAFVDTDSVTAANAHGVLTITLKRSESEKPRRITVTSADK